MGKGAKGEVGMSVGGLLGRRRDGCKADWCLTTARVNSQVVK